MKFLMLGITFLSSWINVANAQQHVHGQGSVFIVQENTDWLIQFVLPASDILGFEHKPQNPTQHNLVSQLKETQKHFQNLIQFDSKCKQLSYSQTGLAFEDSEDHGVHEDHKDHEDSGSSKHHHQDIEVTYTLECQDQITHISFPILDQSYNLRKLYVQWSMHSGQGSQLVTNNTQKLEW